MLDGVGNVFTSMCYGGLRCVCFTVLLVVLWYCGAVVVVVVDFCAIPVMCQSVFILVLVDFPCGLSRCSRFYLFFFSPSLPLSFSPLFE